MVPSDNLERRHLALAERHIAEARERLTLQEATVARLPLDTPGRDAAETLLAVMRQSFDLMLAHRATILDELAAGKP